MSRSGRRAAATGAAAGALIATIVGLTLLGRGDLASPPFTSLDGLRIWLAGREPAVALFAIVRLLALAVAWYLLLLLLLGVVAGTTSSRSAARAVAAASPPGLRRAATALLGLGLVGATGRLVDHGPSASAPTERLVPLERPADPAALGAATEVLVPLDEEAASPPAEATLTLLAPAKARHAGDEIRAGPPVETWVVEPGDHLWAIAETHLRDLLGRAPTDAETVPYWHRLIEHNRSRLPDPRLPDLLFVGQTIELP